VKQLLAWKSRQKAYIAEWLGDHLDRLPTLLPPFSKKREGRRARGAEIESHITEPDSKLHITVEWLRSRGMHQYLPCLSFRRDTTAFLEPGAGDWS